MTNPYAVIGLTFDGTDVQQDPIGIFLEVVRGLSDVPAVRGTDTVVPGLAGRIPRNRVADHLTIELRGFVAGTGSTDADCQASHRGLVNDIRALFDPTAAPADLVAALEDASTATIAARTLNIVWDHLAPSTSRISIELDSVAPDWTIT